MEDKLTDAQVVVHEFPARRSDANYILRVKLESHLSSDYEQIWARNLNDDLFEVCCIPFFADGIALFDIVRADKANVIQEVVEKKGHTTFRIVFAQIDEWENVLNKTVEFEGVVEVRWHQSNLVAIDAPNEEVVEKLVAYYLSLVGNVLQDFEYNTEVGERG